MTILNLIRSVKSIVCAMAVIGLLSVSVAAHAGKDMVVVFNMQAALMQTKTAQKMLKQLETDPEYAKLKKEFEGLRADLIALDKNAKNKGMTWSDEQRAEHRKAVEYKNADLKLAAEKLKAEQNAVAQKIMRELGPKAKTVLEDIVKKEDIALVLDSNVAFYAKPQNDITNKVTERLDKGK